MKRLGIALFMVMSTGCMSFSDRPLRLIRNAILEQNPGITLEKEVAVNVGWGGNVQRSRCTEFGWSRFI